MDTLTGKAVIVAGGTGNIGGHIVASLLEEGAAVAVPSRSEARIAELRAHLAGRVGAAELSRFHPHVGDVGVAGEGEALRARIARELGPVAGVVASLGRFVPAPSLLEAEPDALRGALEAYTLAHFAVARAFLPLLEKAGGTYVFINGPLAFSPWPDSGAGLVSVATAAQHMLFRAVAQEREGRGADVLELVVYSFVRDRETQPGSPVPVEAVGRYVAHRLAGGGAGVTAAHGSTVHLSTPEVLAEALPG